jgi:hypothetical protein
MKKKNKNLAVILYGNSFITMEAALLVSCRGAHTNISILALPAPSLKGKKILAPKSGNLPFCKLV